VRIVLDTNVVVSVLLWGGTPYRLMQAAVDGAITLCASPELLSELNAVLARDHLRARLELQSSSVAQAMT
jgi:putative PIN family toxin of toxin-antitoxin system